MKNKSINWCLNLLHCVNMCEINEINEENNKNRKTHWPLFGHVMQSPVKWIGLTDRWLTGNWLVINDKLQFLLHGSVQVLYQHHGTITDMVTVSPGRIKTSNSVILPCYFQSILKSWLLASIRTKYHSCTIVGLNVQVSENRSQRLQLSDILINCMSLT